MPKSQQLPLLSAPTQKRVWKEAHKTVHVIPNISGSGKESREVGLSALAGVAQGVGASSSLPKGYTIDPKSRHL